MESLAVFLRDLPEDTPRYQFLDHEDTHMKILSHAKMIKEDKNRSPFLVFMGVNEETFQMITSAERSPVRWCIFTYSHHLNCMVLELISETHEAARDATAALFDKKVAEMGLYSTFGRPGSAARCYNDVTKQPDAQWMPFAPNEDPSKSSILLEISTAATQKRMENEAKRWLTFPHSSVMEVIGVKVYNYPKVVVNILGGYRKPHYKMAGSNMVSTITREDGTTQVDRILYIPFEFAFWRVKNKDNPNKERDIVFNKDDLAALAESIWKVQGLM